jgi:hypothetical protein
MEKKYTEGAKTLEKSLSTAMAKVFKIYKTQFPELEFKTVLTKFEIAKLRGLTNYNPSNPKSCIKPDGGMIFLGNKLVLCSEAKTQGNENNYLGNAIERAAKNYLELAGLCRKDSTLPYVIFCSGSNFKEGSSLLDRIDVLTDYLPRNTILCREKVASVYTKETDFNVADMMEVLIPMINISLGIW